MNYELYAYIPVTHCCQVIGEVCSLSLTCEIGKQKRVALESVFK